MSKNPLHKSLLVLSAIILAAFLISGAAAVTNPSRAAATSCPAGTVEVCTQGPCEVSSDGQVGNCHVQCSCETLRVQRCAVETKQCPDGTTIRANALSCEFPVCPTPTPAPGNGTGGSGDNTDNQESSDESESTTGQVAGAVTQASVKKVSPAAQYFIAVFGHKPDAAEQTYWEGRKKTGSTLRGAMEWHRLQGQTMPGRPWKDLVKNLNAIYRSIYGRTPTVSEHQYWLSRLSDITGEHDLRNKMLWHKWSGITH